ncbi:hypothetical protein E2320_000774 [Naja naja]|nr:hypothetical protein E2320_000774 [Naja naja]
MMWQTFLPSLLCLFLQLKFCLSLRQCRWLVALSETKNIEGLISSYIYQEELRNVAEIFRDLKDSPIDPSDKDANYYGFPYFLKVSLSCVYRRQEMAIRVGHYSGLTPIVRVYFREPVNPVRQKQERLRIEMKAAPYRMNDSATCDSEEICKMFWFAPMPFLNGSVVHHVLVKTNGFGLPILNKLFYININGFMEPFEKLDIFRIGNKLYKWKSVFSLSDPSRPLWATYRKAPVRNFSSSIVDAIATESTLFIRQNQLVYYFTGHYPILHQATKGSGISVDTDLEQSLREKAASHGVVKASDSIKERRRCSLLHFMGLTDRGKQVPSAGHSQDFVLSFTGPFAIMTDREELWVSSESGIAFRKVYPSDAWHKLRALQRMRGSTRYSSGSHSIISIFYNPEGLQEVDHGKERFLKRNFPQDIVLTYDLLVITPHKKMTINGKDYIQFTHLCPFATMRMVNLPRPQRYTREEYYWATPPDIMDKSGFHHKDSLTVYQGLVYQLLQLHSSYHREYFSYKASNWKSLGGIYVDMANYAKIYNVMPDNDLPQYIYLDKNTAYSFNVFLTIRSGKESMGETTEENSLNNIWLTVILTHPEYVTIRDSGNYPQQDLSGKNLLKSSASIKVVHSEMSCYRHSNLNPELTGIDALEIHIGCPPGKRLAFDITYTKNYTTEKNKRYFDLFFPFFLIQDMVTGDSGRFHGSNTTGLIWARADVEVDETNEEGFPVLSESNSGIVWICQKDSPCYDIVPQSMATPDYFFVIKVSNSVSRGVKSCQNARESFFLRADVSVCTSISMAVTIGLVILYILVDVMAPRVKEFCNKTLKRLEDAIAFRAESSLTFSSSFSSQVSLQHLPSDISSGEPAEGHTTTGRSRAAVACRIHQTVRFSGAWMCHLWSVVTVRERLAPFSPFPKMEGLGNGEETVKHRLSDFGNEVVLRGCRYILSMSELLFGCKSCKRLQKSSMARTTVININWHAQSKLFVFLWHAFFFIWLFWALPRPLVVPPRRVSSRLDQDLGSKQEQGSYFDHLDSGIPPPRPSLRSASLETEEAPPGGSSKSKMAESMHTHTTHKSVHRLATDPLPARLEGDTSGELDFVGGGKPSIQEPHSQPLNTQKKIRQELSRVLQTTPHSRLACWHSPSSSSAPRAKLPPFVSKASRPLVDTISAAASGSGDLCVFLSLGSSAASQLADNGAAMPGDPPGQRETPFYSGGALKHWFFVPLLIHRGSCKDKGGGGQEKPPIREVESFGHGCHIELGKTGTAFRSEGVEKEEELALEEEKPPMGLIGKGI